MFYSLPFTVKPFYSATMGSAWLRCNHKFGDGSSRVKNWKRMFRINNQKQIVVNAGVFYVFGSLK